MHPGKDHERALLAWVKQQGAGATIDADYAQGFSGTKVRCVGALLCRALSRSPRVLRKYMRYTAVMQMDTILEKGFADMMRGVEAQVGAASWRGTPASTGGRLAALFGRGALYRFCWG